MIQLFGEMVFFFVLAVLAIIFGTPGMRIAGIVVGTVVIVFFILLAGAWED